MKNTKNNVKLLLTLTVFVLMMFSPNLAVAETDTTTDSYEDGYNVLIDGYEIMTPAGWSDVAIATQFWAASITDIGITTVKKEVDFNNKWVVDNQNGEFDMMMQCCTPHLVNDAYTVMGGWRGNTARPWNNASWWSGTAAEEFNSLWEAYPNTAPEDRADVMSQMQEILAREKPTIVSHVNGFWYLVNTEDWTNWPSEANAYQDPQTAYTINTYAMKQRMYLGLNQAGTDDTVWNTGYDTQGDDYNPWNPSQSFGIALMYEPLFGYIGGTGDLIPVLGTDAGYSWNADGSVLTVPVREDAYWSDGENVTAEDVKYSYLLAANQSRWVDMSTLWDSISVDGNNVIFNMASGSEFNFRMEQYLYQDIPIVPMHVWTEICEEYDYDTEPSTFKNDWLDGDFPAEWKVASGPYRPYSKDLTAHEELYEFDTDWWGSADNNGGDVIVHDDIPNYDGVPDATYVGLRVYSDNTAKDQAILLGEIDLHAGFYASVWTALAQNEYLQTWFGRSFDEYYLGLGAVIEIAPNHLKYPFNQLWFREAVAYAINYDPIGPAATGGYWSRARQGVVDNRSAVQALEYDPEVQAEYGVDYNQTMALEIMNEYCFQKDGKWYTKDVPEEFQGTLGAETDQLGDGIDDKKGIPGFTLVPLMSAAVVVMAAIYRKRK